LSDGSKELSVTIEAPGAPREHLWYQIPAAWAESVSEEADPLVTGALFRLMRLGRDARVHGDVSASLLASLAEFQSAWAIWRPWKYKAVEIEADRETHPPATGRAVRAISAFSGGVDSSFTAFRHVRGVAVRRALPLKASVMVHGFDIPLSEPGMFERARARAAEQVNDLGLDLIPVATNFRSLEVEWTDAFGSAVASSLMLFRKAFDTGIIAQGVPYHCYHHMVEGSNPLTDALLTSDTFRIIPDGAAFQRIDKIEALSRWPAGVASLRVCWQGPEKDRNCCRCEKCIRNILSFRALGLGLPPCFERDVTDEQIRSVRGLKEITISVGYEEIIRTARLRGAADEPWVRAVRSAIRASRRDRMLRKADLRPLVRAVARRVRRLAHAATP